MRCRDAKRGSMSHYFCRQKCTIRGTFPIRRQHVVIYFRNYVRIAEIVMFAKWSDGKSREYPDADCRQSWLFNVSEHWGKFVRSTFHRCDKQWYIFFIELLDAQDIGLFALDERNDAIEVLVAFDIDGDKLD